MGLFLLYHIHDSINRYHLGTFHLVSLQSQSGKEIGFVTSSYGNTNVIYHNPDPLCKKRARYTTFAEKK